MTDKKKTLLEKLEYIQQGLKAPKSQVNNFGNYNYRSCEDILEAVKPLLKDCVVLITDKIGYLGERHYVKATAKLVDSTGEIKVSAYARESLDKKGMDQSQITGAASSYARKYALNGLFAIDDEKDADTKDNTKPVKKAQVDMNDAYDRGMSKSECKICGEKLVKNPKTGSWFCPNKCWLKKNK